MEGTKSKIESLEKNMQHFSFILMCLQKGPKSRISFRENGFEKFLVITKNVVIFKHLSD